MLAEALSSLAGQRIWPSMLEAWVKSCVAVEHWKEGITAQLLCRLHHSPRQRHMREPRHALLPQVGANGQTKGTSHAVCAMLPPDNVLRRHAVVLTCRGTNGDRWIACCEFLSPPLCSFYHVSVDKPVPPICADGSYCDDSSKCVANPPDCGQEGKPCCINSGGSGVSIACKPGI
jgi:hypothetical protein